MAQNLISQTMTDAQRDAMLADLTAFATKFQNYVVNLSPDQIARLSKIKATDIGALEVTQTFVQQNPNAISADMNTAEMDKDVALARQLIILLAESEQKTNTIRTSLIAVLSDGRVTSDGIYRVEKAKGKNPQNAAFLETYGARYAHGPQTPPAANP